VKCMCFSLYTLDEPLIRRPRHAAGYFICYFMAYAYHAIKAKLQLKLSATKFRIFVA
jgi:hypothetical protein